LDRRISRIVTTRSRRRVKAPVWIIIIHPAGCSRSSAAARREATNREHQSKTFPELRPAIHKLPLLHTAADGPYRQTPLCARTDPRPLGTQAAGGGAGAADIKARRRPRNSGKIYLARWRHWIAMVPLIRLPVKL
jgi:hypothetical protein